jgi:hypothetical protein
MTLDEFWDLIESTRVPDAPEHAARLIAALGARPVDDILAFGHQFGAFHVAAYRWDLWGAAYLINGGCGNDSFMDFRTGLILRGQQVYEAALTNPDSLADVPGAGSIQLEEYIGPKAYRASTGRDDYYEELARRFPPPPITGRRRPLGTDWDFDSAQEMQQRYPRLWARLGG